VVGALSNVYQMSIAEGYICLINPGANAANVATVLQASHAPAVVANQIVQRMREIKPDATAANCLTFLNNVTVNGQTTVYIYGPSDGQPDFQVSATPPTLVPGVNPDGVSDSWKDSGYEFKYAPSSGFNNLLGQVTLSTP
jgi:hypothetical protein